MFRLFKNSLLIILSVVFVSQAGAQAVDITFVPHWLTQAQFAGYYVAEDMGFYEEADLAVHIAHPSASIPVFEYLKDGQADIVSAFLLDGLKERIHGTRLINVAQLSQHSALMMVARKTSSIDEISDFNGKQLGIWSSGFDDIPVAFIQEHHLNTQLVPVLNTITLFLMEGVDALTVMYYNEYDQIINSGINEDELNTFFFADYGFDIPEDAIYVLEKTLNQKPVVINQFVRATFKGWDYAAENRDYAIELVVRKMKEAHIPVNKAHQKWMLDKVLESADPGKKNTTRGQLLEEDFNQSLKVLSSGDHSLTGLKDLRFEDFYRPIIK